MESNFDLEVAKRGGSVEKKLYRATGEFQNDWTQVHFVGLSQQGRPVVQEYGGSGFHEIGVQELRTHPSTKVLYRLAHMNTGGVPSIGICNKSGMFSIKEFENFNTFCGWIHTEWQEFEIPHGN